MEKNNALIGIGIAIAVIYLISLAPQQDWFPKGKFPFLSAISNPPFQFSGFTFEDEDFSDYSCNVGGSTTSLTFSGEYLVLDSDSANSGSRRTIRTDITDVDEVIILYDGSGTCYASEIGSVSSIIGRITDGNTQLGQVEFTDCSKEKPSNSIRYEPSIWSFKNNFDGTWSSTKRIGQGDIVKFNTKKIEGDKQYLELEASSGNRCGGGSGGKSQLRIYNIITKKSGFSICKIDERGVDKNNDGEITSDECTNLTSIDLQREEAILQSVAEQIRLLQELNQRKVDYLEAQIAKLQNKSDTSLLERINQLEQEKEATSLLLGKLQSRDAELIYAIEQNNKVEIINKTIIIQEPVIPSSAPIPTVYKIVGGILGVILFFKLIGVF